MVSKEGEGGEEGRARVVGGGGENSSKRERGLEGRRRKSVGKRGGESKMKG